MPSTSTRNQKRYRNSETVLSSAFSMRSERPQSLTWRSGSTPGRYSRRSASSRAAGTPSLEVVVRLVRRSAMRSESLTPLGGQAEQGCQRVVEARPVVGADDVLGLADVLVPRVHERRRPDARVDRADDVHRRVVDEQLDADLAAAGDLVERAVQLVEGQPDVLQPRLGRRVAALLAVAGDVDEVPGLVPARHGLDRALVWRARGDRLVGVRLGDADLELMGLQARDPPVELLLVGQLDAEAPPGRLGQAVPVVVEGRVDVDGDAHAGPGRG